MSRLVLLLAVTGLLLAACGAAPTTPTSAPLPTVTSAPATAAAQAAPATTLKDLVASDPAVIGSTGRPQVIEFFAYWCDVCQGMYPTMDALQKQYGGQVDFVYLNIDAANTKDLQRTMGFTGLRPTIIFRAADGTEVSRLVGAHPQAEIAADIEGIMAVG